MEEPPKFSMSWRLKGAKFVGDPTLLDLSIYKKKKKESIGSCLHLKSLNGLKAKFFVFLIFHLLIFDLATSNEPNFLQKSRS